LDYISDGRAVKFSQLEKELNQKSGQAKDSSRTVDTVKSKSLWQELSDLYFTPKSFERSGRLYEALGIKFFRKYCPNAGSYWTRKFKGSLIYGRTRGNLEDFVNRTKILESIHFFGALPIYGIIAYELTYFDNYIGAGAILLLNFGANIWPIMAQRYNRNKVNQILARMG